jgi:outer membrane protein
MIKMYNFRDLLFNVKSRYAKRNYFSFLIIVGLTVAFPWIVAAKNIPPDTSSKEQLSLARIWDLILVNDKTIALQRLAVDRSTENMKEAQSSRLPEANVNGEYTQYSNLPEYEHGIFHTPTQYPVVHTFYSLGTSVYLNIFNGKKTSLNIAHEKNALALEQEREKLTSSEIRLLSAAYYLDLQRNLVFKELLLKDIEEQHKQLEQIRALKKNGVVLKSDVLRAELKLSRQDLQISQVDNDIVIATQKLNIMMGRHDREQISPVQLFDPDTLVLKTWEGYISGAGDQPYEIKIAEKTTELKRLELKSIRANVSPSVGFYADYAYSYPQGEYYPYSLSLFGLGSAGIKASFPISSLYLNRHKAKAAEIAFKTAELEQLDVRDVFRQKVTEAVLQFKQALLRLDVSRSNILLAKENQRVLHNSYFNQASLITDLLDADTQLLESRFEMVESQTAAQLSWYQLQKNLGKL